MQALQLPPLPVRSSTASLGLSQALPRRAVRRAALDGAEATSSYVQELESEEAFDALLQSTSGTLVLNCSATWCGPCKLFKPTYIEFAEAYRAQAVFVSVTGDRNASTTRLMKRLAVKSVPTFMIYRGGELATSFSGANKTSFRRNLQEFGGVDIDKAPGQA